MTVDEGVGVAIKRSNRLRKKSAVALVGSFEKSYR